jgi:hypothetical protein
MTLGNQAYFISSMKSSRLLSAVELLVAYLQEEIHNGTLDGNMPEWRNSFANKASELRRWSLHRFAIPPHASHRAIVK